MCQRMHTSISLSSIFNGCTVRFACFCHGKCLRFATQNSPTQHFFTCRIKPSAKTAKRLPRTSKMDPKSLRWNLQKHSEEASETTPFQKALFALEAPRGIWSLPALGPGKRTPVIYRYIYIYIYIWQCLFSLVD